MGLGSWDLRTIVWTHCAHTSSMSLCSLIFLLGLQSFLNFSFFGWWAIESSSQNSERCNFFQCSFESLSLFLKIIDVLGNFNKMFLHGFSFDLNIENILKVLTVGNWIVGILDFLLVKCNLLLDILQMIFSVIQIQLLYFILLQQIFIVFFLFCYSLLYLPLLVDDES